MNPIRPTFSGLNSGQVIGPRGPTSHRGRIPHVDKHAHCDSILEI